MKKYQIIYADPPWKYYKITKEHPMKYNYSADKHYPTMPVSEICNLPIRELSDKNCILFMWATFPNLKESLDVIKAWGFKYKTLGFCWIKTGRDYLPRRDGMGYYTKSNAEICLIGTKGKINILSHSIPSTIMFPRTKHSVKPEIVRDKIIQLVGDLPRIELFARQKTEGWDCLGNEINGKDIKQELEELINGR